MFCSLALAQVLENKHNSSQLSIRTIFEIYLMQNCWLISLIFGKWSCFMVDKSVSILKMDWWYPPSEFTFRFYTPLHPPRNQRKGVASNEKQKEQQYLSVRINDYFISKSHVFSWKCWNYRIWGPVRIIKGNNASHPIKSKKLKTLVFEGFPENAGFSFRSWKENCFLRIVDIE